MTLAQRQAELVAALVAGGGDPPGFSPERLAAARAALLRKRAGEVARAWPELLAATGPAWPDRFAERMAGRATAGALHEGWLIAREFRATLPQPARIELAIRECAYRFGAAGPPRRRRWPAFRLVAGAVVIQLGGRVRVWNRNRGPAV